MHSSNNDNDYDFIDPPKPSHILEVYDIQDDASNLQIPGAKIKSLGDSVKLAIFKNSFLASEALSNSQNAATTSNAEGDDKKKATSQDDVKYKLRTWQARIDANMTIPPVTKHHHGNSPQQQRHHQHLQHQK